MSHLVTTTKALADDSRLRILMALDGTTLCLSHLTEILELAPSTVSKHLQILANAGLVTVQQEGRWRYYRLATGTPESSTVRALAWVTDALRDEPITLEDEARRAIALETQGVPLPQLEKPKVLFLCTGNACRSQIAEALLRHHAGDRFDVFSAGIEPRSIPDLTRAVMGEWGLDITDQRSKDVREFLGKVPVSFLVVVCKNAQARCPVFPGAAHRIFWPIESPTQKGKRPSKAKYRAVRDLIDGRILRWLDELSARGLLKKPVPNSREAPVAPSRSAPHLTT